jgi:hypothetical protein
MAAWLLNSLMVSACATMPEPMAEAHGDHEAVPISREATVPPSPTYETILLPAATVHLVTIPDPGAYPVQVSVADQLTLVKDFEVSPACLVTDCAIAAINAGFFDPNNRLTTSYVTIDGALVADPRQNERLVGNSNLEPYMNQILNRSEFRRYDCEGDIRYNITFHDAAIPAGCTLVEAVGAGPQLLPRDTSEVEGFVDPTVTPMRDALGSQSANARSAIGIKADGSIVLAMVAQVPGVSPSGMNFAELANLLTQQGVTQALNLDGGSSSTLVYDGISHFGRLNSEGEIIERPVKSILWVGKDALE